MKTVTDEWAEHDREAEQIAEREAEADLARYEDILTRWDEWWCEVEREAAKEREEEGLALAADYERMVREMPR